MTTAVVIGLGVLAMGVLLLCIGRAIVVARTPHGAAAWVIFLLSAPWFAVPAFAVFGNHKTPAYVASRRRSRAAVAVAGPCGGGPARAGPRARSERLEVFQRIAGLPALAGNECRLLIDGEATFAAIFAAIDGAERYICVQFYTIVDDATGRALADRLVAAAERGVRVFLIYDGVGSYGLSRRFRARLAAAGVVVVDPRAARGPTSRMAINYRNHRKTVIVDGRTGFLGGLNASDTYVGRNPRFGYWRDTHLQVRGPVVAQLQGVFAEDWHWGTGELLTGDLEWTPEPQEADMTSVILPTGPADSGDTGAQVFFAAITSARHRLWLASPYFVPDDSILAALGNAAMRGVDVRVILSGVIDHYLPWFAAHAFFDEVRANGVEIFHYMDGVMHQKVLLCDDDLAAVGTANCDIRSFRLNFETMAMVHDPVFAAAVERMLARDLQSCRRLETPLSGQPFGLRLGAAAARLLAPVL